MIPTVRHVTQNRPVWEHVKGLHAHRRATRPAQIPARGHALLHVLIPAGQHVPTPAQDSRVWAHAIHLNARGQSGLTVTIRKSFPPATGRVARVHLFFSFFQANLFTGYVTWGLENVSVQNAR